MATRRALTARAAALVTAGSLALGVFFGTALVGAPAFADTAPPDPTSPASPPTVSADALPTAQINGVAWSQVVVGNTVYVAGSFTTARPAGAAAGTNTVTRNNLMAYNIETGVMTSWAPSLNAQALAIAASPDGSKIYVTGDFTTVDGANYYRIAAFNTATGAVIPGFKPILGSQGRALAVTNSTVYVGGTFRTVSSQPRDYLAAVDATTGAVKPFVASANLTVSALAVTKDNARLVVGGRFSTLSGVAALGLGSVDPTTGASQPFAANQKVQDSGTQASITSLIATSDRVYGTGYVFGAGGNLEGTFSADPTTGNINWIEDCHGDTYSSYPLGDVVYVSSHAHYCGNIGGYPQTEPWTMYYATAFSKAATGTITPDPHGYYNWAGNPSPTLLNWFPKLQQGTFTGQGQAGWSVSGNSRYVTYAGEFPNVNGVGQQGLVRFPIASIAPNKVAPIVNTELVPTVASFKTGEVRLSWTATYDYDNANLTYKLVRDGATATPIYTANQLSNFYTRAQMGFIDKGLAPGSTHTYRLYVSDPYGNSISRLAPTATVASSNSGGAYAASVEANNPSSYWPLDEASGSSAFDHVAFNDLALGAGVTRGAAGIVGSQTASTFSGNTDGLGSTPTAVPASNTFSAEAWIKTTTTSGGKIIGYGNTKTGDSSGYDRHVYMDDSGKIWFGVYPGGVQTINTTKSYNDGAWHQIVATLGANGMNLFIDGKLAGSRSNITTGQDYAGFWRVGGDNLGGWPNQPSSKYFAGTIAQVAIYPTTLNRNAVNAHWVASGRPSTLPAAPADAYGSAVFNDDPTLFWRLNETSGAVAADSGQQENPGNYFGSPTQGVSGVLTSPGSTAAAFGDGSGVSSANQFSNPGTYSVETWFNTSTTAGGKLIGFGDQPSGQSGGYDRHLYMQDDGKLVFGTWTGQTNTVTTPAAYNDGKWHYAVATQSGDGIKLYLDGVLIGTNPQTSAQDYAGYWRIGGDTTWGSSSPWFDGKLDEVAVYARALSASTVADHFQLGGGVIPVANVKPTAAFVFGTNGLAAGFDGTGSSDSDGTIGSYAWNFGDGATDTGSAPSHTFATAGTYTVTLTVTDDDGATDTVTHDVQVADKPPVNVPPTARFDITSTDLTASFDASASTDSDGIITQYNWDFGDGKSGTGATTSHTYDTAGTYTVSLVAMDDAGGLGDASHTVTVTAPPVPNVKPTARFSSTVADLNASFTGAASTDSDGTVASYAWEYGDTETGTGVSPDHTYAAAGTYTVKLTVTDDDGATDSVTHDVTVTAAPVPNVKPTARFSSTVADLRASFTGAASTDSDGTVASYAWEYGDTTSGTGVSPDHTYTAAGTYTVKLTVTDDDGATDSVTHDVTVTAPAPTALATDTFGRTVASGWGTAPTGGAWTITGTASNLKVADGVGYATIPAGSTRTALLNSVSSSKSDTQVTVSTDTVPTGGGTYNTIVGRQVGANNYTASIWVKSTGTVVLVIKQGSTVLASPTVTGLTYTAGTALQLRFQVNGTSPTTLRAKIWRASASEPTAWLSTVTDSTSGLQSAGSVGIQSYLSASATATVVSRFDNFTAVPIP